MYYSKLKVDINLFGSSLFSESNYIVTYCTDLFPVTKLNMEVNSSDSIKMNIDEHYIKSVEEDKKRPIEGCGLWFVFLVNTKKKIINPNFLCERLLFSSCIKTSSNNETRSDCIKRIKLTGFDNDSKFLDYLLERNSNNEINNCFSEDFFINLKILKLTGLLYSNDIQLSNSDKK